jgi:hypothetical protein
VSVCGTVTNGLLRGFSWQRGIDHFADRSHRHQVSETRLRGFACGDFLHPWTHTSNRGLIYPSASPHRSLSSVGSTGMLTRFPSATPFGLALGPTNPERIDLPQETLGFRRTRFSRVFSLLVPAGSLPCPPPVLVGRASHSDMECSSTNRTRRTGFESAASVSVLSPGELSARTH